jgi:hypothetical protein
MRRELFGRDFFPEREAWLRSKLSADALLPRTEDERDSSPAP